MGFRPTRRGNLTVSIRGTRALFERTFGTQLDGSAARSPEQITPSSRSTFRRRRTFSIPPALAEVIDDAYIQWPHIYMAREAWAQQEGNSQTRRRARHSVQDGRRAPAGTASGVRRHPASGVHYYHLEIPAEVTGLLNVPQVHKAGTTGKGVRVAMVDTGFAFSHPYFAAKGYNTSVDLAPHASNDATDPNGHGTGESANLYAVAPGITFIGIKVDNDDDPRNGASMLEGFQQALMHNPQIISLSMGYDLRADDGTQQSELPSNLAALEAEIQAAVGRGIIVVFSAGNGHYSFPGHDAECHIRGRRFRR